MSSTPTRNLVVLVIVVPMLAILAMLAVVTMSGPGDSAADSATETTSTAGSAVVFDLHVESLLAAQAALANGTASDDVLADQQAKTDTSLQQWRAVVGADEAIAQLETARGAGGLAQAEELLVVADAVAASNALNFGSAQVAELHGAARADVEVGLVGAPQANATSSSKAKRTRVTGMAAVADLVLAGVPATASTNLGSVLASTGEVRSALSDGAAVTLGSWIDSHVARQQALREVARALPELDAGGATEPEAEGGAAVPLGVLWAIAGVALVLSGLCGWLLFGRLRGRSEEQLVGAINRFGNEQVPASLAAEPSFQLGDEIEPVADEGDLSEVASAFNSLQQNAAYVIDRQRQDHRGAFAAVFRSLSDRSAEALMVERNALSSLAQDLENNDEIDPKLRVQELLSSLGRRDRDVHFMRALAGTDAKTAFVRDQSVASIVARSVDSSRAPGRVDVVHVGSARIDSRVVVDVESVVAELLDAALHQSAAESMVELTAELTTEGSLLVTISGDGNTMAGDRVDQLNEILGSTPLVNAATADSLDAVALAAVAERAELQVRYRQPSETRTQALLTVPVESVTEVDEVVLDDVVNQQDVGMADVNDEPVDGSEEPGLGSAVGGAVGSAVGSEVDVDSDLVLASLPDFDPTLPVAEFEFESADEGHEVVAADASTQPATAPQPSRRVDYSDDPFAEGALLDGRSNVEAAEIAVPVRHQSPDQTPTVATTGPEADTGDDGAGGRDGASRPSFAEIDSLLNREAEAPEPTSAPVRPPALSGRIPTGPSTVKPGGIRTRRARSVDGDRPRSSHEVREMLSRYRTGTAPARTNSDPEDSPDPETIDE